MNKYEFIENPNKPIFCVGKKVTYIDHSEKVHGIIKRKSDEEYVFVVYHCDNDWKNYSDYTAARTKIDQLVNGWID